MSNNYYARYSELVNNPKTSAAEIEYFLANNYYNELIPETVYLILKHPRTPLEFKKKMLTNEHKLFQLSILTSGKVSEEDLKEFRIIQSKITYYVNGSYILLGLVFASFISGLALAMKNMPLASPVLISSFILFLILMIVRSIKSMALSKYVAAYLSKE